jgi:hypothetical protein
MTVRLHGQTYYGQARFQFACKKLSASFFAARFGFAFGPCGAMMWPEAKGKRLWT